MYFINEAQIDTARFTVTEGRVCKSYLEFVIQYAAGFFCMLEKDGSIEGVPHIVRGLSS